MRESVVILVPIYKEVLNEYEELSIKQLVQILGKYSIQFITHKQLDLTYYKNLVPQAKYVFFKSKYFKSPQTYNRLLTSKFFFKAFSHYQYFLMYHTDAFVFKNELEYWLKKGYDYIGAPLFKYHEDEDRYEYALVGNGGFSLHNIESALKVLSSFKRLISMKEALSWYNTYNWKGKIKNLPFLIGYIIGYKGNSYHWFNHVHYNEDIFWGRSVRNNFEWYKVAPFNDALKFSMEYNCEELYKKNNYTLPFGTHQWFKGAFLSFWNDKIYSKS